MKIQVFRSKATGQWRWRVRAGGNHKIIATSGESYHNFGDCINAIDLLRRELQDAEFFIDKATRR